MYVQREKRRKNGEKRRKNVTGKNGEKTLLEKKRHDVYAGKNGEKTLPTTHFGTYYSYTAYSFRHTFGMGYEVI